MWATRIPALGTLEAIRAIRRQRDFKADEVKALRVRLGKGYSQNVEWAYTPTAITLAQLNPYFICALMLLEKDVFTAQFTMGKIRDPRVLDPIQRTEITHGPVRWMARDMSMATRWKSSCTTARCYRPGARRVARRITPCT